MLRHIGLVMIVLLMTVRPMVAGVRIVRLNTDNLAKHLSAEARETIGAGDVLVLNESLKVAILTTAKPSDPTRAGRCLLLAGPESALVLGPMQIQPVQGLGWERPEAGLTHDLAVVRFRRGNDKTSATLTYRVASATPWLEVSTQLVNSDGDRILELPVVDAIRLLPGAKGEAVEGALVVGGANGSMAAYLAAGQEAVPAEGNGAWHLGLVSGDPMDGALKRASQRILSFGRAEQSFRPVEASREWKRSLRDREAWFRLAPGTQRVLERRLVVASSRQELTQLAAALRQGVPHELPLLGDAPGAVVISPQPRASQPAPIAPVSRSKHSSSKIVGRLRSGEAPSGPSGSDAPPAMLHPPLPAREVDASMEMEADNPSVLAPTIEAIENLPPPIE